MDRKFERYHLSQTAAALADAVARSTAGEGDPHCDVLIVGSGYGGAVAAARLAGLEVDDGKNGSRPATIWLLERGLEHAPGEFPSRLSELPGQVRYSTQDGKPPRGHLTGLFDLRLGDDVNVLVGNGLGGGSLINAGVLERPRPAVFDAERWPGVPDGESGDAAALQPTTLESLEPYYQRAIDTLQPSRLPDAEKLPGSAEQGKFAALARTATGAKTATGEADAPAAQRASVAVTFADGESVAKLPMAACTHCGDCMTGCNQGAKNTLDTNYLALAAQHGVRMFCGGWVDTLMRDEMNHLWQVDWWFTDPVQRQRATAPQRLRARNVVLAAGTLGSTEILLRSDRSRTLFSTQLGQRFSANGNLIAAAFRQQHPVNACGDEDVDPADPHLRKVGPTVSGLIRTHAALARPPGDSFGGEVPAPELVPITVEDFGVPAALRRLFGEITTTFGSLHAMFEPRDAPGENDDPEDPLAVTSLALQHTMLYGIQGNDGAAGSIRYEAPPGPPPQARPAAAATRDIGARPLHASEPGDGAVRIVWDDPGLGRLYEAQTQWLTSACKAGPQGTVVPTPTWRPLPGIVGKALGARDGSAFTAHPLGGCAMAAHGDHGVVNWHGAVFKRGSDEVHETLAVVDGSIVPTALAINPILTITALAERAVEQLARQWRAPASKAGPPPSPKAAVLQKARLPQRPVQVRTPTRVRLREQMTGPLTLPNGNAAWVEVEVEFDPVDLATWLRDRRRRLLLRPQHSRLRVYAAELGGGEPTMPAHLRRPLAEAALEGSADILVEPASDNRVADDGATDRALLKTALKKLSIDTLARNMLADEGGGDREALGTMVGKTSTFRRELVYRLKIAPVTHAADADALKQLGLAAGDELVGTKTIAFGWRSNPWTQLSRLHLRWQRGALCTPLGALKADLGYFAEHREALVNVERQQDQTTALADLAAFALLTLRVVARAHLLNFVPPRDTSQHIAERRPGKVAGQMPWVVKLDGDAQLSHYLPRDRAANARPLLMIHGLSASGSTFTHSSIPTSLVQFMLGQGRDCWVLDLRTSAANEHRPGPFTFEETAAGDIPRAIDVVLRQSDQQKVDVVAHCIGSAMFCMAVLEHPSLHLSIGHAVLSQVGPAVRLSPLNRLRGFIAGALQQYLDVDELDVRFDYQQRDPAGWQRKPGREPPPPDHSGGPAVAPVDDDKRGAGKALLDGALATLVYPEGDIEEDRAAALDANDLDDARDFRLVRHRADAIVGHSFELENVGDDTLLALDAIFGWVKTRTLAQVQYFARQGVLTNAVGANDDVSDATLRLRFSFPVMLLHGRRNRVFDWQGARTSYRLLKRVFGEPAGSNAAANGDLHLGLGSPRQLYVFDRYGHQDPWIGKNAAADVFPVVETFLQADESTLAPGEPPRSQYFCEEPWIGPRLGWMKAIESTRAGGLFELALQVHSGPRNPVCLGVVLVPLGTGNQPQYGDARIVVLGDRPADQCRLLLEHPLRLLLAPGSVSRVAFVVLTLHSDASVALDIDDYTAQADSAVAGPAQTDGGLFVDPGDVAGLLPPDAVAARPVPRRLAPDAALAVRRFVENTVHETQSNSETRVVRLAAAAFAAADQPAKRVGGDPTSGALSFAMASCLYPPNLFDKPVAQTALRRLRLSLRHDHPPGFLLLLGDQIYLDATAVAIGKPNIDIKARLQEAYELNWRLREFRRVAARLPTYSMIDDHEVANDWQPPERDADLSAEETAALHGYRDYQGKLNPAPWLDTPAAPAPGAATSSAPATPRSLGYRFAPGGLPFFVLDTRTRRQQRCAGRAADGAVAWNEATLVPEADMQALEAALLKHKQATGARPFFVATPSAVFPLPHGYKADEPRLDLDNWAGYPASLLRLLGFIRTHRIENVVLLSGDEHLSLVAEASYGGGPRVLAVVASGLHAPWTFANRRRDDYEGRTSLRALGDTTPLDVDVTIHACCEGANHVVVHTGPHDGGGRRMLGIDIVPADRGRATIHAAFVLAAPAPAPARAAACIPHEEPAA